MDVFSFRALGTEWSVLIDAYPLTPTLQRAVVEYTTQFEQRFSRFLPHSEVNAFRKAKAGTYPLSEELSVLLGRADILRRLTGGIYDPAVGGLLEQAGYGMSKKNNESTGTTTNFSLPHWSLMGTTLTLDGPVAFDLGGMGKGYCIDGVARVLEREGCQHYLVEGGGDMWGTTKADGSPWQVAIEYPGKPELAAGTMALSHQGLAVSDRFRRRFGRWHHIVHPIMKQAVNTIDGCAAVAPSAWDADCMTSGLFLAPSELYPALAHEFQAEYLVFLPDSHTQVSSHWPGALFT